VKTTSAAAWELSFDSSRVSHLRGTSRQLRCTPVHISSHNIHVCLANRNNWPAMYSSNSYQKMRKSANVVATELMKIRNKLMKINTVLITLGVSITLKQNAWQRTQ